MSPPPIPPSLASHLQRLPRGIDPSEIAYFSTNPLAQPTISDPLFRPYPMSRTLTHSGRGHTLMASTWNTDSTIAHLLSFARKSRSSSTTNQSEASRTEVRRFYTFGSGLNAHPNLLHGGVIACILDSTMGNAVGISLPNVNTGESTPIDPEKSAPIFTAQLNVSYKAAVQTPGTIMVRAWVERIEGDGRKIWPAAIVESLDSEGKILVHARAEGLWIRGKVKEKL